MAKRAEAIEKGLDPDNFGNLSSIMINPADIVEGVYNSKMATA